MDIHRVHVHILELYCADTLSSLHLYTLLSACVSSSFEFPISRRRESRVIVLRVGIGVVEAAGNHTSVLDVARYEAAIGAVHGSRSHWEMLPSRSVYHRSGVAGGEEHRSWETRLTQFFFTQQRYSRDTYFCKIKWIILRSSDKGDDNDFLIIKKLIIALLIRSYKKFIID